MAKLLGYQDLDQAIKKNVDSEDMNTYLVSQTGQVRYQNFINESGFYSLVFSSKKESAKIFTKWVTSVVLPSIRKYGSYKLFDNTNDLYHKAV